MGKKDILEWIMANSEALSKERILLILLLSLFLSLVIFIVYKVTYNGVKYNVRNNIGNIIVMLIATVVMMMISTNIAISLGMVGALSIVRFRTAIKDPQDTLYIFWSMIEGLCVGAQMNRLAIISTIFIAIVLIIFSFYEKRNSKYLIVIRGDEKLNVKCLITYFDQKCKKYEIKSSNVKELSSDYIVEVGNINKFDFDVINEIKEIENVVSVNCILEE